MAGARAELIIALRLIIPGLSFCIHEGCAIIGPALLRTALLVLFYIL